MKTYTKEDIVRMLTLSNTAVERAVMALYERQTADEQATQATREHNGVGFNGTDAPILTSFAEQLKGIGWYTNNYGVSVRRNAPRRLSEKQLALARRKVLKYAGQLAAIANANTTHVAEAPARLGMDPQSAPEGAPREDPVAKPRDLDDDAQWNALGSALAGYNSRGERWNRGGFKNMRAGVRI